MARFAGAMNTFGIRPFPVLEEARPLPRSITEHTAQTLGLLAVESDQSSYQWEPRQPDVGELSGRFEHPTDTKYYERLGREHSWGRVLLPDAVLVPVDAVSNTEIGAQLPPPAIGELATPQIHPKDIAYYQRIGGQSQPAHVRLLAR
jgi:hypothetical protein